MVATSIVVKHAGKTYPIELDTSQSVPEFRELLYNVTGVAPPQQKILLKGVLKDDASLEKLGIKSVMQLVHTRRGSVR